MTRRTGRMMALLVAGGVLVACGGSDDDTADEPSPAADQPAAESDGAADAAGDAGGSDDDAASSDDAGDADAGTNDEAQQSLDDAGVDMDLDELEETVGNMSTGEGGGVVMIDGEAYPFEATGFCVVQGTDFVAEGLGSAPDGTPAWVSINHSLEDFDGDGEESPSIDVMVDVGRSELFGSGADDAPAWSASSNDAFDDPAREITAQIVGESISGGGPIADFNGIAVPFGETVDMTFEANCAG